MVISDCTLPSVILLILFCVNILLGRILKQFYQYLGSSDFINVIVKCCFRTHLAQLVLTSTSLLTEVRLVFDERLIANTCYTIRYNNRSQIWAITNTAFTTLCTRSPIITEVNPDILNAKRSILVILLVLVTEVKFKQAPNAPIPILVTL